VFNPYLSADFHDEDLHMEWLRLRHEALAAQQSGDADLRDDLAGKLAQVEHAISARSGSLMPQQTYAQGMPLPAGPTFICSD
jgi:hypothetical protein